MHYCNVYMYVCVYLCLSFVVVALQRIVKVLIGRGEFESALVSSVQLESAYFAALMAHSSQLMRRRHYQSFTFTARFFFDFVVYYFMRRRSKCAVMVACFVVIYAFSGITAELCCHNGFHDTKLRKNATTTTNWCQTKSRAVGEAPKGIVLTYIVIHNYIHTYIKFLLRNTKHSR